MTSLLLTEAQEEVLVLIGHGVGECVEPPLRGARGEVIEAGLVSFATDTGWTLTDQGQAAFDRLCRD